MYIFSTLLRGWRAWRDRTRTRNRLRVLDEHILSDIGIRRDEIDALVERSRSHAHLYGA